MINTHPYMKEMKSTAQTFSCVSQIKTSRFCDKLTSFFLDRKYKPWFISRSFLWTTELEISLTDIQTKFYLVTDVILEDSTEGAVEMSASFCHLSDLFVSCSFCFSGWCPSLAPLTSWSTLHSLGISKL